LGKEAVVMAGPDAIEIVSDLLPLLPRLSLTLKVMEEELAAAVGVPEMTPVELRVIPAGKVPLCTEKV
jgi:hypothetical protein